MRNLLIFLRLKQLFAHNCHNFVSKETFFQDHEFFGSLYAQAEGWYDSVIERMIGLGLQVDPIDIQVVATNLLKDLNYKTIENKTCYQITLSIQQKILSEIEKLCKSGSISQGTMQLIGGIADLEEVNVYKIKQRLKG